MNNPIKHIKQVYDFSSDGCSNSPDFNFYYCCKKHDYYYRNQTIERADADTRLRKCIQRRGWVTMPWIYWTGVRLFGWWAWNKNKKKLRG